MQTTISVSKDFPMRPGEVLRIKEPNGKGIWRTYYVGALLTGGPGKPSVYEATVRRG